MSKNRLIEDVSKTDGILFFSVTLSMASMRAWYKSHGRPISLKGCGVLTSLDPEKIFKIKHNLAIVTPLEEEFDDNGCVDFKKVIERAREYDLRLPALEKFPALLSFVSSQKCRQYGDYEYVCHIDNLMIAPKNMKSIFCAVKTFGGGYALEVHSISSSRINVFTEPSLEPAFLFERIE